MMEEATMEPRRLLIDQIVRCALCHSNALPLQWRCPNPPAWCLHSIFPTRMVALVLLFHTRVNCALAAPFFTRAYYTLWWQMEHHLDIVFWLLYKYSVSVLHDGGRCSNATVAFCSMFWMLVQWTRICVSLSVVQPSLLTL